MVKRILVPLDHGTAHETILPLVADMARAAGATVRLLHVAAVPDNVVDADGRVVSYADQEMSRQEAESREYLEHAVAGLEMSADCRVRFGDPITEIFSEAEAFEADLIALTTTCRSSVKRHLLGSVADKVLTRAKQPVLLLRPALGE